MPFSHTPTPPLPVSISPEMKHENEDYSRHDHNERSRAESPIFTPEESALRQNNVSTVILHAVPIVCLFIDGKERLCLAQISNTLLKDYSYNEIHNRRVALGITCVQCTPVQLEILRRAGAMPISSRRCGMITKREADRLVKSFLEEHTPPKLPDNFAFCVKHSCGWGSKGQFVPARYNSSRAKCIKCGYCNLFFSPNKFIFHFHRAPDAKYRHPDAANFNSWRRHLNLDYDIENEDLMHAWEDVKAMFNGGSRKRILGSPCKNDSEPDFSQFDKKPRFEPHGNTHQPFPSPCPPIPTQHFPFMSMPNNSNNNMMIQFPPTSPYPSLHHGVSSHDKPAVEPSSSSSKANFNELWKRPPTIYNPFSFWWAKSIGVYPFSNVKPSSFPNGEWNMMEGSGGGGGKHQVETTGDNRYSAFKPVGLLGSRVFSDYNSKFPFFNHGRSESRYPKCHNNNNNVFSMSSEASQSSKSDFTTNLHNNETSIQHDEIYKPKSKKSTIEFIEEDNQKPESNNRFPEKELEVGHDRKNGEDKVGNNCETTIQDHKSVIGEHHLYEHTDSGREVDICGEDDLDDSYEKLGSDTGYSKSADTSPFQEHHHHQSEHLDEQITFSENQTKMSGSIPVSDTLTSEDEMVSSPTCPSNIEHVNSSIPVFDMSKEELQRELLKMMSQKQQN